MVVNFTLVTELQGLIRRDFPVDTVTVDLDPNGTNPLIDGEFMNLNSSYKLIRGINNSLGWAVFSERGRFDVQVLKKVTVLFLRGYEADTRVFAPAGITLGAALSLNASVTVSGVTGTKSGLGNYSSGPVIGYVTRHPNDNGGKLRFIQTLV